MTTTSSKKAEHIAALDTAKKSLAERIASARTVLHNRFADAFEKANEAFSPENMRAQITEMLTKERKEIIYKLLGLRSDWNRIELEPNHKNGMLPNLMDATLRLEVERWVETEIRPALMNRANEITNDPKFRAAMVKEFAERFRWRMQEAMDHEADKLAEECSKKYAKELRDELSMVEKS